MLVCRVFLTLAFFLPLFGEEIFLVQPECVTAIEHEGGIPLTSIDQMVANNDFIYFRGKRDPHIVVLNRDFEFVMTIGRRGPGPGEFSTGVDSMSVDGSLLFAMDKGFSMVHVFRQNVFSYSFKLDGISPLREAIVSTNAFAVEEAMDRLIAPSGLGGRHLASVFDLRGRLVKSVGKLVLNPGNMEDLRELKRMPHINDTLWICGEKCWVCLFKFIPQFIVFDSEFRPISEKPILQDFAQYQYEKISKHEGNSYPGPIFTDIGFQEGCIFAMSQFGLHRISLAGVVESSTFFMVQHSGMDTPQWFSFSCFAFLDTQTVLLANNTGILDCEVYKADLRKAIESEHPPAETQAFVFGE